MVFLQEKVPEKKSCEKYNKKWNDDFKGTLFFSHGRRNSCGVAIGAKSFRLEERKTDKNGRILLLDVKID